MAARKADLASALEVLRTRFGPPERPPTADPFELVLLENVACLAKPERRREAFEELKRKVGTSPAALARASRAALERIASRGILPAAFAEKLRECARIVLEEFGGDLAPALDGTVTAAKKALLRFPGIGEPGAEKILLFSGCRPFLAPDSNGLRVLIRLDFAREEKSYAKSYAAARAAAASLPARIPVLQEAHLLLQRHGQTLCRVNDPLCESCPLRKVCVYAIEGKRPVRVRRT
jgi:endonuclease III